MAYVKNEWVTGDVITAEKLNNIEEGIEDSSEKVLYVHIGNSGGSLVADKTISEISQFITDTGSPNVIAWTGTGLIGAAALYPLQVYTNGGQGGYHFRFSNIEINGNNEIIVTCYEYDNNGIVKRQRTIADDSQT